MTKTVSNELINAIELLHHLPARDNERYKAIVWGISERVAHIWWELKTMSKAELGAQLAKFLYHSKVQPVGTRDVRKEIELQKIHIMNMVQSADAAGFSHTILGLFWISWWENLFILKVFNPEKEATSLLRIIGTSQKRIRKILWWMLQEDVEKVIKINDTITQGFTLLRERLYLLRMPVSNQVEEIAKRTHQVDEILVEKRYLALINEASVLLRRIGGNTNHDALAALDDANVTHSKTIDQLDVIGPLKPDITIWAIHADIRAYFGVTLTSKNPHHVVNPRSWKKMIQHHLLKAAFQKNWDLTKLILLQNSIRGVLKSIDAKEELTDDQRHLIDDIVNDYSQSVIRKIFDEIFYQCTLLFRRPR